MTLRNNSPENVGRIGHETIGAEFLRSLGFGENVCRLVGNHVDAKRYVVTPRVVQDICWVLGLCLSG
jgi:predicted HD phosphohydrolase